MTAQIRPKFTERGLARFEPVSDVAGCEVRLVESSRADEPFVWLSVTEQPTFDHPSGAEATAHLPLDTLQRLRDQIEWLLVNHFLINPSRTMERNR